MICAPDTPQTYLGDQPLETAWPRRDHACRKSNSHIQMMKSAKKWRRLTAGLIAYAKACFAKSDGAFDITSGLLRKVWDFSAARLPDQASISRASHEPNMQSTFTTRA